MLALLATVFLLACSPPPAAFHNTDLTGASFGRDFSLSDHHGQARHLGDYRGKVVVIFFGYTSCPDICPTMLSRLADVRRLLGEQAGQVQVLFVTVDPERDSEERLREFVPWFDPDFVGLRGDPEQTAAVKQEYRVVGVRRDAGSELGYLIDHSAGAYVYDAGGRLRLYIGEATPSEKITADIRLLLAGR